MPTKRLPALLGAPVLGSLVPLSAAVAQDSPPRPDLMSFAQGVLPVVIDGGAADLRVTPIQAIAAIDGSPVGFVLTPRFGAPKDAVEITYGLPAPARFDRFAVYRMCWRHRARRKPFSGTSRC